MMKRHGVLLLVLGSMLAASCSKDPVSSLVAGGVSSRHRMIFSPDTLKGQVYQYYAMKARIEDVGLSDIYLNWEFEGMANPIPYTHWESGKPITNISYLKNGRYKIKATAYDAFNDTLVRVDSTVALVDSTERTVDLLPNSCDTGLAMNPNGSIAQAMNFSVKTGSLADFFTFDYHLTGPGLDTAMHLFSGDLNFTFAGLGTYLVRVAVYDGAGKLYGTDSSSFHVTMPKVDVNMLKKMSKISVFVALDSISLARDSVPFSPVGVGLPLVQSLTNHVLWNGNSFSVWNTYDSMFSTGTFRTYGTDSAGGTLSADAQTIVSAGAMLHDSLSETSAMFFTNWSGSLRNLTLFAVTDTSVVYAVSASSFQSLSPDFSFSKYQLNDALSATVDQGVFLLIFDLQMLKPPSAYVVFTK